MSANQAGVELHAAADQGSRLAPWPLSVSVRQITVLPGTERTLDLLGGKYRFFLDYLGKGALIGHIHHIDRKGKHGFGSVETPVGYMLAHMDPGREGLLPHCSARLLLRSDIRYEADVDTTTVVGNPSQIAGPSETLLLHLISLRDSALPACDPGLALTLGKALIQARWCSEPMLLHIDRYTMDSHLEFGRVSDHDA
jgi:hypothetical protein